MLEDRLPVIETEQRDEFLALFEPHIRPMLTDLFLTCGPRAGIVISSEIMGEAVYHLRSRIDACDATKKSAWREVLCTVADNWEAAEMFCDYCVRYAALPECYRARLHSRGH